MTKTPASPVEPSFLMRADESAQMSWANVIKASVSDPIEGQLLVGVLKHPFLRHLMELYLNNSVTSLGAAILIRRGFADVHEFRGREEWCRGKEFGTIELNKVGLSYFESLQDRCLEKQWFETLADGITEYACRDAGEGVCLGREHLASAIENRDVEILRRVVDPLGIEHSFLEVDDFDHFTDEARLATEEFWSPNFGGRNSAKVLTSVFEYSRPRWSLENEEDFDATSLRDFLELRG